MSKLSVLVTFKLVVDRDEELSLEDDMAGWEESVQDDPHAFIDLDDTKIALLTVGPAGEEDNGPVNGN